MPDITLRAYSKEIDDLIEHDQLDEAIAHCRHILQTYPKHLETYRALGKSYLEAKRYGDAADIFQRVLSAIPDDFVSHIGMSIVREDEGNLDSSIWHMERAFETNPANPAIQQELRRLIGRRDGLEPHKVRLTRGALARMYAQGELYPQAIAELRSALAEERDRPDLNVLLAKMYWNTEQLAEAVDVCHSILDALPFCLEANKIMAAVLQITGKADDARAYQRRMVALDPYTAFIDNPKTDPHTVDPASVRLAKLDWIPGQPMPSAEIGEDWASSLGVDSTPAPAEPADDSSLPAWMADLEQQQAPPPPPVDTPAPHAAPSLRADSQPFAGEIPEDDGSIPEWMRAAGWTESDGEAPERPVEFSDAELSALEEGRPPVAAPPADEGELAPADIPSWLQDIAPEEAGDAAPEQPEAAVPDEPPAPDVPAEPEESQGVPDWLSDIAADAAEVTPEPEAPAPASTPEPAGEAAGGDVPSWLDASSPGATSTIVTWLGDRSPEEPEAQAPAEELPVEPESEVLPDWMSGESDSEPEAEPEEAGPPSWLSGVAEAAAQPEIAEPIIPQQESVDEAPEAPPEVEPEAPDWLQAIASSDEEEPAEVEEGESPDWLSDLRSIDEDLSGEETPEPPEEEELDLAESADWLSRIGGEESDAPADTADVLEAEASTDEEGEDDWLARLTQPDEPAAAADEPDWLQADEEPAPAARTPEPDWLSGLAEPEPAESPADSAAESLDWLDGIAEDQPAAADEDSLDWLSGIGEEPAPDAAVEAPAPTMDVPDWMQGDDAAAPTAEPVADEEMEWLKEFKEASEEPTLETAAPAIPATEEAEPTEAIDLTDADDGEVMQWLETLAEQQEDAGVEAEPAPEAAVPAAPEALPAGAPIPDSESEGLDWLEELADSRGLDERVEIAPSNGAEEDDGLDWLQEMAEPEPLQPEPAVEVEAPRVQPAEEEPPQIIPEVEVTPAAVADLVPPESTPAPIVAEEPPFATPPEEVVEEVVPEEKPQEAPVAEEQAVESVPERREPAPTPSPAAPEPPKAAPVEKEDELATAGSMLASGDTAAAAKLFGKLIKRGKELDAIITTLSSSLADDPRRPEIWQALGDAYMKNGQMNEAVDAYQRGMEVA